MRLFSQNIHHLCVPTFFQKIYYHYSSQPTSTRPVARRARRTIKEPKAAHAQLTLTSCMLLNAIHYTLHFICVFGCIQSRKGASQRSCAPLFEPGTAAQPAKIHMYMHTYTIRRFIVYMRPEGQRVVAYAPALAIKTRTPVGRAIQQSFLFFLLLPTSRRTESSLFFSLAISLSLSLSLSRGRTTFIQVSPHTYAHAWLCREGAVFCKLPRILSRLFFMRFPPLSLSFGAGARDGLSGS